MLLKSAEEGDQAAMHQSEFANIPIELPPGLPKLAMPSSEMSPPPYIPASKSRERPNGFRTPRRNKNQNSPGKNSQISPPLSSKTNHGVRFELINEPSLSPLSVPIMGIRNEGGVVKYPILLYSQEGSIMLPLTSGVLIELCVDRSFRVMCNEDFMAYVNSIGSVSSIIHRFARIVHGKEHVHCKFISINDRLAILGPDGVLFSLQNLSSAYLVSSANHLNRPAAITIEKPDFPIQEIDYTLHQMYGASKIGVDNMARCHDIVQKATHEKRHDGTLCIHINGINIKSNATTGDVSIETKAVKMSLNSKNSTVHIRSSYIDMAIQDRDKCFVKRGDNRIHSSRSGMVVSNGTCNISIDQCGKILSCS